MINPREGGDWVARGSSHRDNRMLSRGNAALATRRLSETSSETCFSTRRLSKSRKRVPRSQTPANGGGSSRTRILSRGLPLFEEGSSLSVSALRGHPSSLVETCFSTRRLSETGSALSDPREWGGRGGGGGGSRHTRMLSRGFVYLTRSWCGGYVITVPSRGSRHDKVSGGWR